MTSQPSKSSKVTKQPHKLHSKLNLSILFLLVDKLYWISAGSPPKSHSEAYFFNVDSELVYEPFNSDFGPLNLAMTHKYIRELCRLLADPKYINIKLFHYTCLS